MKSKVAPRLTALDMYGITTYNQYKPSGIPAYPDMDEVQRVADSVIYELDRDMWTRELGDIVEPLTDLKDSLGCDTDELDNFLETTDQVVSKTKTCIIEALTILDEAKGDTTLPDYVVECIERATERLHEALPDPTMYTLNGISWTRRGMSLRMVELLDAMRMNASSFSTDTDDPHNNVFVHKRGSMKLAWDGAKLSVYEYGQYLFYITADRLFVLSGKHSFEGDSLYGIFHDWTRPTPEEIKLFNMVFPNVPGDIWEFLGRYVRGEKSN